MTNALDQVGRSGGVDLGTGFRRLFKPADLRPHKDFMREALTRIRRMQVDEVGVNQFIDSIDFRTSIVVLMTDKTRATSGIVVIELVSDQGNPALRVPTLDMVRGNITAMDDELHRQQTQLMHMISDVANTDAVDARVIWYTSRHDPGSAINADYNKPDPDGSNELGNVWKIVIHK